MDYRTTIRNEVFRFKDLKDVLAKANEVKSGDELAGIAAGSARERVAAKFVLADLTLEQFYNEQVIDPGSDDVSRLIIDQHDTAAFSSIRSWTVGDLRNVILAHTNEPEKIKRIGGLLSPEMVAAVTKLMSNQDLILASANVRNVTRCRNTMGERGVLGIRLQPNHPTDDRRGILLSTVDGLLFGCGDAVIGVNPAAESVSEVSKILALLNGVVDTLGIPTQVCCLSHMTTQLACLDAGTPIDLLFQSIAGSEAANRSFGISLDLLSEGRQKVLTSHHKGARSYVGEQVMYFETGQGSALSANAHHGVDQLTMEARAYAVARFFDPFLVNSVVGFIGPEYLANERQIIRAGLEDHFMAKLMGLPMGVDVCYTNHADADQNSADNLLVLLTAAGCNYFMGVPCADDVMLSYQSTSFHDGASMRRLFGKRPTPEFDLWLNAHGLAEYGALGLDPALKSDFLKRGLAMLDGVGAL